MDIFDWSIHAVAKIIAVVCFIAAIQDLTMLPLGGILLVIESHRRNFIEANNAREKQQAKVRSTKAPA